MWTMLAGVPGKLKTLLDRLTATRAANLDRLDADVSTRAPASTALSNAVWTDTRAGLLDTLNALPTPDGRPPISDGLYPAPTSVLGATSDLPGFTLSSFRSSVGTSTVVNISGAGVLQYTALRIQTTATGQNVAAELRLTIDGVEHSVSLVSNLTNSNITRYLVGYVNGSTVALDAVPFRESLKIELICSAITGSSTVAVSYKLRRVA